MEGLEKTAVVSSAVALVLFNVCAGYGQQCWLEGGKCMRQRLGRCCSVGSWVATSRPTACED